MRFARTVGEIRMKPTLAVPAWRLSASQTTHHKTHIHTLSLPKKNSIPILGLCLLILLGPHQQACANMFTDNQDLMLANVQNQLLESLSSTTQNESFFRFPFTVYLDPQKKDGFPDHPPHELMTIASISPESGLVKARPGDFLLKVDGSSIGSVEILNLVLSRIKLKTDIVFEFARNGMRWKERGSLLSSAIPLRFSKYMKLGFPASFLSNNQAYISPSLLDLVSNEDELAYVMAHEIGHYVLKHERQESINAAGVLLAGGLALAVGASTGVSPYIDYNLLQLTKPYEYTDELIADQFAKDLMHSAGYNAAAAEAILKKIPDHRAEADDPNVEVDYTIYHSVTENRVNDLRRIIPAEGFDWSEKIGGIKIREYVPNKQYGDDVFLGVVKDTKLNHKNYQVRSAQVYRLAGTQHGGGQDSLVFNLNNTDKIAWIGAVSHDNYYKHNNKVSGELIDSSGRTVDKCISYGSFLENRLIQKCIFNTKRNEQRPEGVWQIKISRDGDLLDHRNIYFTDKSKRATIRKRRNAVER